MKNLLFILIFFSPLLAIAQQKPTAPVKYTVSWGGFRNADIPAESFKKIADSTITVRDEKGNSYPVTRFRINYTFVSTYKDSETQQRKDFKDFRAFDFYDTNVLSDTWKGSIKDNAKKGDEVIINNIMIRQKNGKKLMVGDWRGTLK